VTPIAVLASVPHVPHVAQQRKRRPPGTFQDQVQISCGTGLADAGIDVLVLRDLMGHASPETTAGYVHLSAGTLAREYEAARRAVTR
jgi:integrase